ncbi:putative dynamin-related protein [Cryptosporidium canis]|uniref:Dynamin-related protein n=1 Tax=Cryptosporidium canis TaxID=195482 RepID=A0A9D5HUV5_9CRYT|nr:putative dynamin-related protein [Cryptosporidium canis]
MDSLIPVINELHDILTILREGSGGRDASEELSLELPEIAVVGSQSVGKSSLLEYIIGEFGRRHILPRGQGIVTRRPLILQLQQLHQDSRDDYAEFGHKKGLKFTDFEKVKEEIQAETNRLLGDNKNVSDVPILLRIFSKKAIGLTLVDLPGLTKVPIEDQPNDIESQIRKIVLSYIRRPSCLILAITAANTDIANSDSLNIAREVDPEGSRTIGVLSKLDTVEDYSTSLQVLSNQSYPLGRGYVGVMCRDSRQRTGGPRSLRASLNDERSFFENNSKLKAFQSRCGTYNLVNILQREFLDHILRLLPRIKSQSKRLIELKQAELLNYGDSSRSDILDEIGDEQRWDLHGEEQGGRHPELLFKILEEVSGYDRWASLLPDRPDETFRRSPAQLRIPQLVREHAVQLRPVGRPFGHGDQNSDKELNGNEIKKLLRPSLTCVEQVYDELRMLVDQCSLPELSRYSNLKSNMISVVNGVLEECLGPTNRAVVDLINMELAYINTNHPDFIGGASALSSIFEKERACLTESLSRSNSNERQKGLGSGQALFDADSCPRPARTPKALSRLDGVPHGVGEHCGLSKPQASGGPPAEPQRCGLGPQGHHVFHGERRQGRDPERAGGQAVQGGDLRRSAPGGERSCREETAVPPEYQQAV